MDDRDTEPYLKSDAPDWLREIVKALQPRGESAGAVVIVQQLSSEAIAAYERGVMDEGAANERDSAEVAPILFPVAFRVLTSPAVMRGAKTGGVWVFKGAAGAAGVDAYNKVKGIFS